MNQIYKSYPPCGSYKLQVYWCLQRFFATRSKAIYGCWPVVILWSTKSPEYFFILTNTCFFNPLIIKLSFFFKCPTPCRSLLIFFLFYWEYNQAHSSINWASALSLAFLELERQEKYRASSCSWVHFYPVGELSMKEEMCPNHCWNDWYGPMVLTLPESSGNCTYLHTLLFTIQIVHGHGKKCINNVFFWAAYWKCRLLQPSIPRGWFCRVRSVSECSRRWNIGEVGVGQDSQENSSGGNGSGVMVHV